MFAVKQMRVFALRRNSARKGKKMKIKKELIIREIAGDTILVPVGKTVYDSNGLFVLNELGAFIWKLLPAATNENDIMEAVLREYDVSREEAQKDISEFLEKLKDMGIL